MANVNALVLNIKYIFIIKNKLRQNFNNCARTIFLKIIILLTNLGFFNYNAKLKFSMIYHQHVLTI